MPNSTLTPEQRNQHDAKAMLAAALNSLRKHAGIVISDLENALEILRNVERSLESLPFEADADLLDLDTIAKAVREADDEWGVPIRVRSIQDDVDRAKGDLSEAVGQLDYLIAGDFSDDA